MMLSSKQLELSMVEILPRAMNSTIRGAMEQADRPPLVDSEEEPLPLSKWKHSADESSSRARDQATSDLLHYVQILEQEKRDFQKQIHALKEKEASHQIQLATAIRRIGILETSLETALKDQTALQQSQRESLESQRQDKEKYAALEAEIEDLRRKLDDTERARHYAVFRLSEMQADQAQNELNAAPPSELSAGTTRTTESSTGPLASSSLVQERGGLAQPCNEGIEQMKREMELWRQRAALQVEQLKEKHQVAMELALRKAQLDHATLMDKMKLETEIRLSEWRHEEALRAREIEAAMEEDRYSIRLEMKHGMQRAQIEHQVLSLRSQVIGKGVTGGASGSSVVGVAGGSSNFTMEYSVGTLDEVLVRMQMELVRRRRFDALRKMMLIRNFHRHKALRASMCRWTIMVCQTKQVQCHAVLHMARIVNHLQDNKLKRSFGKWRFQSHLVKSETFKVSSMHCWNRMLAVERINHVLQQQMLKRVAMYFFKWKQGTSSSGSEAKTFPLQQEIKKLHEQLALSKAEAWRYKRQLLKQFL